ncbi:amino acid adenylation domain-containing protein [Streptomyces sp. N50]|uniref:amino acid adenylation domain-containing protein n=1 Tax=Streptomyces sp. N50 TaxID=3081765 RepID=UPI0029622A6C|nr:amino acid adenylation domain-containing protein [Streptomyces sp. N50]WOX15323.1 amino acid adenylation domain-containing protein [Streptomyces sp. N50]
MTTQTWQNLRTAECVHTVFARTAALHPGRTAVSDGRRSLSYAELDAAADRLAHRLRALGAGPEVPVGVCLERDTDLVVGLLGVLKSGACYVPLDPRHPTERLRSVLDDTGASLVVGGFSGDGVRTVPVAGPAPAIESGVPLPTADPARTAYIIHTSGSTGRPKGVPVTHTAVVRMLRACQDRLDFSGQDVWTLFHSVAFDFSVWETWGPLLLGGRLVVVPYELSRDPDAFLDLLLRERVTVTGQTPSAFRQLLRAAERARYPVTDLRVLALGGESLQPSLLRPWFDHYGDASPRLFNMYGLTESTVVSTVHPLRHADAERATGSIGRPLPGTRVHLLDENGTPVSGGATGEVHIAGDGIGRGYLNRPELTEERFVPDPFGRPGARMYRTGDLASYDVDGDLVFHGRADSQVQLRGFRIEPGEVEAAVKLHQEVADAVVTVRENTSGVRQLVCHWIPRRESLDDGRETAAAIRGELTGRLPEHLIPAVFVAVDRFPLTTSGKLDLAALPAPARQVPAESGGARPLDSPAAALLAGIWAELLELDQVAEDDNFFSLGGDSMLAVEMIALAQEQGVEISMPMLFADPTIVALVSASAPEGEGP